MTKSTEQTKNIIHSTAKFGAILYITFLILEFLKAGLVTNYIDLNIVLVAVLVIWIADFLTNK